MKRGVIEFTKAELDEIMHYFDLTPYAGYPLESKLLAAIANPESSKIELSQEELETILDSIIIVTQETDILKAARSKIQQLLLQFQE